MAELFDTFEIGSLRARNRVVRAATAESLCTKEGAPSPRLGTLYRELAEGGTGVIITGYAYVSPDGKPSERCMSACDDSLADAYRELIANVHEEGGSVVMQLAYGGSKSKLAAGDERLAGFPAGPGQDGTPNVNILGPSAIAHPATGLVPRPATEDDLLRVRNAFAGSARRAQQFGFDGVEVHAAHGYLLSQFLDGRFNKRTDRYGGTLENRARLAVECVRAVRGAVGPDFPVLVKLNSCDARKDPLGDAGGMSEEESLEVAQMLAAAGASCIDVSGDWHAYEASEIDGEPFFGAYSARLASKVDVPVIVTGGWRDPEIAKRYLESTGIAAIGMARPLVNEPFLAARWEKGDLRPAHCLSCNFCTRQPGISCIHRL